MYRSHPLLKNHVKSIILLKILADVVINIYIHNNVSIHLGNSIVSAISVDAFKKYIKVKHGLPIKSKIDRRRLSH